MKDNRFYPVGGLVLIRPLKLQYRTEKQVVPTERQSEIDMKEAVKGEGKEIETEVIKQKVKLQHQLAEVITTGNLDSSKLGFKAGDIIVYDVHSVRPFDLQKNTFVMSVHNILGVWLEKAAI